MRTLFCPECGKKLDSTKLNDEGIVPFCANCNKPIFKILYPCVILLVINEYNEVCVIRQSYGVDKYVLVAGFIKYASDIHNTILEEISEEINHKVISYTYINSYFQQTNGNLMIGFKCDVLKEEFVLSTELKEAKWVDIDEALRLLENSAIALRLLKEYLEKTGDKSESN